jgi:hypothetical protein
MIANESLIGSVNFGKMAVHKRFRESESVFPELIADAHRRIREPHEVRFDAVDQFVMIRLDQPDAHELLHVMLRGRRGDAEPVRHYFFCGDGLSRFAHFAQNALTERAV